MEAFLKLKHSLKKMVTFIIFDLLTGFLALGNSSINSTGNHMHSRHIGFAQSISVHHFFHCNTSPFNYFHPELPIPFPKSTI